MGPYIEAGEEAEDYFLPEPDFSDEESAAGWLEPGDPYAGTKLEGLTEELSVATTCCELELPELTAALSCGRSARARSGTGEVDPDMDETGYFAGFHFEHVR